MTGLGWCGLCGTTLDEAGARRCGCAPLSELAIVTSRAVVMEARSGGGFSVKELRRALRLASADRRIERKRRAS